MQPGAWEVIIKIPLRVQKKNELASPEEGLLSRLNALQVPLEDSSLMALGCPLGEPFTSDPAPPPVVDASLPPSLAADSHAQPSPLTWVTGARVVLRLDGSEAGG